MSHFCPKCFYSVAEKRYIKNKTIR
ncbi:unnamed protein product, partial [Brachionus calyciflorus]